MERSTITAERERMRAAVRDGFPARPNSIDRRIRQLEERKQAEADCRDRIQAIRLREIALGLRDWSGHREPFAAGTRVLGNYPPREGVVISYEESNKTNGGHGANESIVRYADGSEGLHLNECLVALELEAGR